MKKRIEVGICLSLFISLSWASSPEVPAAPATSAETKPMTASTEAATPETKTISSPAAASGEQEKAVTASAPGGRELTVGVSEGYPFAVFDKAGKPTGIAVDVWEKIAKTHQWTYKYTPYGENVNNAVQAVADGKLDVLIGPISTTHKRMKIVDYTRPFFLNQLGLALKKSEGNTWQAMDQFLDLILSPFVLVLIAIWLVIGFTLWWVEKGNNSEVSKKFPQGVFDVLWLSIAGLLSGDMLIKPRTGLGKTLEISWLIVCLLFALSIAATFTSTLTVSLSGQSQTYHSVSQLKGLSFAAIQGRVSVDAIKKADATPVEVTDLTHALVLLERGKVQGVVEDYLILESFLKQHDNPHLFMSTVTLGNDEFAFVTPKGSLLRNTLDLGITEMQGDDSVMGLCQKYLSSEQAKLCVM